jgi:hypothetical protein
LNSALNALRSLLLMFLIQVDSTYRGVRGN